MRKLLAAIIIISVFADCSKSGTKPPRKVSSDTTIQGPQPVVKTNNVKIYAHYMPWFETPATSPDGKWGQHWTMANETPDIIGPNGRRQIASYFYPMSGPYASSDRDIIDYQLLLMKYSGIDGVIVDWNGSHNVYDYPLIKRNTDSLFKRLPYAGLQFSICYEDAQLTNVKSIAGIDTITAAQQDFTYLQNAYFGSRSYVKINNQPLLLNFGPQVMKQPDQWQRALSVLSPKPCLLPEEYAGAATGNSSGGEFAWVDTNLSSFYERASNFPTWFAGAFPGFKDFYKAGGWGDGYTPIDYNGTSTLQNALSLTTSSKAKYLQLITWNDYGEGTMIEPTLDYNFDFLIAIQKYAGVKYTVTELQLIYKWYTLRAKYKGVNATVEAQLTQAYNNLVALKVSAASTIINGIN